MKKPKEKNEDEEEEDEEPIIIKQLNTINKNLQLLFQNDKFLEQKIQQIKRTNTKEQQQQQQLKEISISDCGLSIKSFSAIDDIHSLLSDRRIKNFMNLKKPSYIN